LDEQDVCFGGCVSTFMHSLRSVGLFAGVWANCLILNDAV